VLAVARFCITKQKQKQEFKTAVFLFVFLFFCRVLILGKSTLLFSPLLVALKKSLGKKDVTLLPLFFPLVRN